MILILLVMYSSWESKADFPKLIEIRALLLAFKSFLEAWFCTEGAVTFYYWRSVFWRNKKAVTFKLEIRNRMKCCPLLTNWGLYHIENSLATKHLYDIWTMFQLNYCMYEISLQRSSIFYSVFLKSENMVYFLCME